MRLKWLLFGLFLSELPGIERLTCNCRASHCLISYPASWKMSCSHDSLLLPAMENVWIDTSITREISYHSELALFDMASTASIAIITEKKIRQTSRWYLLVLLATKKPYKFIVVLSQIRVHVIPKFMIVPHIDSSTAAFCRHDSLLLSRLSVSKL